ncbi:MAG TPA: TldD/PmbA family protein [Planctomycetia bacterium]|nr:TldD/PmbA family protein [Planctomycetia bacterium]
MNKRHKSALGIETLDEAGETVKESIDYANTLSGCKYADIRLGLAECKSASSENGTPKGMEEEVKISFGVRLVAGDMPAWGYYGQPLGKADLRRLSKTFRMGINKAHQRALANSRNKAAMKELAPSLSPVRLAPIEVRQDVIPAVYEEDPRGVPLKEVLALAVKITKEMRAVSPCVKFAMISLGTGISRELFQSTEGAKIDQSTALTYAHLYVVAQKGNTIPETFIDHLGEQRGWEITRGKNVYGKSALDFALERTRDTVELTGADFLPSTDEPVVVVTDPNFNALLVHEIIGHPTEADRALKMETSYAGRSWLLRGLTDNELGKRIGSELLTAFSDPGMEGYGYYKYDSEGVPAKRVILIDKGIFKGFMNGRESANIMGMEPNGSMRATECQYMPLVRMTNTVIAAGDRNPEDIIAEVKDGYYVVNNRIPSISESRENFRISAQKVYRIKDGKLVKLYRGGGISADSRDFFMNIAAVGNDFKLFPIPNCGKGQPMQVMKVGNGGPTIRSKARLTGEYK